jgi:hypothetical protein
VSIIGTFVRVTPAELAQLRHDPTRVHSFVHTIVMAELTGSPVPPEQARSLCVDKCWDALGFLLHRVDFPIDLFRDGTDLGELDDDGTERRCLSAGQVRRAAEWFTLIEFDELIANLDSADPSTQVYWVRWEISASVEVVRQHFQAVVRFFTAAAASGDAVLRYYT